MSKEILDSVFQPKSVAVIGASAKPGKIGYSVVEALKVGKYAGSIFPITPKGGVILGLTAYATILDVKDKVDLAVVTVPA